MEWLPIAIIVAIAALDMVVVVIFSRGFTAFRWRTLARYRTGTM
jgi:hypothetical protein